MPDSLPFPDQHGWRRLRTYCSPLRQILQTDPLFIAGNTVCADRACAGEGAELLTEASQHETSPSVCPCAAHHPLVTAWPRWDAVLRARRVIDFADHTTQRYSREKHKVVSQHLLEAVFAVDTAERLDHSGDTWASNMLTGMPRDLAKVRGELRRGWRSSPPPAPAERWALVTGLPTLVSLSRDASPLALTVRRATAASDVLHLAANHAHTVVNVPYAGDHWETDAQRAGLWEPLTAVGEVLPHGWQVFDLLLGRGTAPQDALNRAVAASRQLPASELDTFVRLVTNGLTPHDAVTATFGIAA